MGAEIRVWSGRNRPDLTPVCRLFEAVTGTAVTTEKVYHREVVARVLRERGRPAADVLVTNSRIAVEALRAEGALAPRAPRTDFDLPEDLRAPDGSWTAFTAWPRVAMVNRCVLPDPAAWPRRLEDLCEPRFARAVACAAMVEMTTVVHFASIAAARGAAFAEALVDRLVANGLRVLPSNLAAREALVRDRLAAAIANSSNVHVFQLEGRPVGEAWLDQEPSGLGTPVEAHVVAVLRGCARPDEAAAFADFLLSEPAQALLARLYGETPVNPGAPHGWVRPLSEIRRTDAPLSEVVRVLPETEAMLRRRGFDVR